MEASMDEASFAGAYQEPPNTETVRRVMLLLSQSKIRQHLECQVRHYLAWKLLSRQSDEILHVGKRPPGSTTEGAQQHMLKCFNAGQTSPNYRHSLTFKATVALILDWLKTHSLIHAADVLCPEAALRETEVMSQQECLAVLRLPPCLLEDQTFVTSAEQDSSLLGRLVTFAAEGRGRISECEKSHKSSNWRLRLDVYPRPSSAKESADAVCNPASPACRTLVATGATSDGGRPLSQRPAKKSPRVLAVTKNCGVPRQLSRRNVQTERNRGSEYKMLGLENEAKTQLSLLAAKIRELELYNSSRQLFTAIDEVKQGVNQRLASIDAKHTARIRRLQKAMKHGTVYRAYERAPRSGLQENEGSEIQRRHLQNVADATCAHEAKDEMLGVAASAGREKLRLPKKPVELSNPTRRVKFGVNKVLAKENASLRLQLVALSKRAAVLQEQLQKYDSSYEEEQQPRTKVDPAFQGGGELRVRRHKPSTAPFTPSNAGKQTAPWAMKEEYEGRVAHLTQELQEKANQIQAKDADFRILVGQLKSARQKSAQVHRRARRLQKLYEAAKVARAQQRRLAASVSLSLRRLNLTEAAGVELDGVDVFVKNTTANASSSIDDVHQAVDLKRNLTLEASPDQSLVTERYLSETGCTTQKNFRDSHSMLLDVNVLQPAQAQVKQSQQLSQDHRAGQSSLETSCVVVSKSYSSQPLPRADSEISVEEAKLLTNARQLGMETTSREPTYTESPPSMPRESKLDRSSSGTTYSEAHPAVGSSEAVSMKGRPLKSFLASANVFAGSGASRVAESMTNFKPCLHWRHFEHTMMRNQSSCSNSIGKSTQNGESYRARVVESAAAAHLPICFNTAHRRSHGEAERDAPGEADSRARLTSFPCEESLSRDTQDHPAVSLVTGQASLCLAGRPKGSPAKAQQTVSFKTASNVFPQMGGCSSVQCTQEVEAATHVRPACEAVMSHRAIAQRTGERVPLPATQDTPPIRKSTEYLGEPLTCSHGDADSSASFCGDSGEMRSNKSRHEMPHRIEGSGMQPSSPSLAESPATDQSFMSSQPETPKNLSNFPSLSCPVAAPSPVHEAGERLLRIGGKHAVECGSPPSASPSESDWLACVSSSPKANIQS